MWFATQIGAPHVLTDRCPVLGCNVKHPKLAVESVLNFTAKAESLVCSRVSSDDRVLARRKFGVTRKGICWAV